MACPRARPETGLPALLGDLEDEHAELDAVLAPLAEADWDRPTPASGWAVRDQISHLAFFDEVGALAVTDPERFAVVAAAALAEDADPMEEHLRRGRAGSGSEVLAWWRRTRVEMVDAGRTLEPGDRVPWFGPPMGALSFVSARIMETWAHGQDVIDALGLTRPPTARLRHVAHLGVRARPFSYVVRGLAVPDDEVRVALTGPSGESWEWGDSGAVAQVRGPALDFCLVVTQRRHVLDTALEVRGQAAEEWMAIAQAFAGPPGPGRPPWGGDPPAH